MATKTQHRIDYQILPPYLREMRKNAGLTQRDLAKLLNKPQNFVHRCETGGRRIDAIELIIWCQKCGVNPKTAIGKLTEEL
jgi:transcriptional regulator with XRE-family HTH domain